ncbi:MAG: efflux RND transporter periplasmic adaptor subunit [Nitrospinae bacterium]|nr:efflux RND transporter periplasmic adaptor subunit [Nitrospinota bacterium]
MKKISKASLFSLALLAVVAFSSCGKKEEKGGGKPAIPSAPITVVKAESRFLPVVQESVGWMESRNAPVVSAEVAGKVMEIMADAGARVKAGQLMAQLDPTDFVIAKKAASAEVGRLTALIVNQQALVDRYSKLVDENFISGVTMEAAVSQLDSFKEQMEAARAQLSAAERRLEKTRITAPISGQVEQRMVSVGSFVDVGRPVFQVASSEELKAFLPFPETVSDQIRTGLKVMLSTPSSPDKPVEGVIGEIRPMVGAGNRAVVAVVEVKNPGGWKAGASVNGLVTIREIGDAVVVPNECVIKRPAGDVVYVVQNGEARQRIVKVGLKAHGMTHVADGLSAGETVALDGAAYLTDKASVTVKSNESSQVKPKGGA